VAKEEVAGSSPVDHPPHKAAVDKRSGSSDAYSPNRLEGVFSDVHIQDLAFRDVGGAVLGRL
jgi:hypothetical protein